MIKRLSLFILPLTLLFSCYQDLSTTADKEFPEIQITGVPDMLETFYGEEIALHAVATLGGEAYDGFDYAWAIDLKPGNSRDRIDISETADIAYRVANQPNETPYCLSFTATDRESGLSKVVFCQVYVRSSLGEGILVAHTRDNGQTTDFDLLANKYVTYGYTSDVPRYTRDIYQLANGQPVNGKVNAVLPVVRTDGAVYNENLILVGTDEHLLALDPLTFKVAKQDGALFNGYKEPTFEVHNLINYGQIMTAAQINGKLWLNICHTNNIFNIAGYSGIPADVFTPTNVGYAYAVQQSDIAFFNEAEGKFYYMHAQFSGYSSFALVTDPVGADLAGGKSLWAGAGKEGRCAFLIQAADGKHHIVIVIGIYQCLLVLRPCLDRSSCHRIADDTVRYFVLGTVSFHDIEDILCLQCIEFQHVLPYFLGTLFKCRHLFLIAKHSDHIVSCHNAKFRKQRPHHLQMCVSCSIEHHRINIL